MESSTYIFVHVVPLRVYNFRNSNLGDFHRTGQAGTPEIYVKINPSTMPFFCGHLRVTVENCTLADALSTSF